MAYTKKRNGPLAGAGRQNTNNSPIQGEEPGANCSSRLPRLAYSLKEAAEILGTSYISLWRLRKRGKLNCSVALRTVLVPHAELERFLQATLERSAS
jgi:hypothetical protein